MKIFSSPLHSSLNLVVQAHYTLSVYLFFFFYNFLNAKTMIILLRCPRVLRFFLGFHHIHCFPPPGNNLPIIFNVWSLFNGQPGYIDSQSFTPFRFLPCSMASLIAVPSSIYSTSALLDSKNWKNKFHFPHLRWCAVIAILPRNGIDNLILLISRAHAVVVWRGTNVRADCALHTHCGIDVVLAKHGVKFGHHVSQAQGIAAINTWANMDGEY